MLTTDNPLWRRIALLAVLTLALALLVSFDGLHRAVVGFLHGVEHAIHLHPVVGALLFLACAALSAMIAFVSVAVLVPAIALAWGEPASLVLLWIGWVLGGASAYAVGRFLGRGVVGWFASDSDIDQFSDRVRQDAPFWLVLLLQLALPSEIPGYVLGLARYPFRLYLLALGLAELPYSFATVYLGMNFIAERRSAMIVIGLGMISLVVSALCLLRRTLRPADG